MWYNTLSRVVSCVTVIGRSPARKCPRSLRWEVSPVPSVANRTFVTGREVVSSTVYCGRDTDSTDDNK